MQVAKFLMTFVDAETNSRTVFADKPDPPELKGFIHISQIEKTFGGEAPNVTRFWPPHMPPMPTSSPSDQVKTVSRDNYITFLQDNPSLQPMPIEMRRDLPLLPEE